jgi:hypothetical protein
MEKLTEKRCYRCGKIKPLEEFNKNKSKPSGHGDECRECKNELDTQYRRTEIGLISKIYGTQKKSSSRRGHLAPTYSKAQLIDFMYKNNYIELYTTWVSSEYDTNLVPSIDRINRNLPYTLENIQLVTWEFNNQKGREESKETYSKRVQQYSRSGELLTIYPSIKEASRVTGLDPNTISENAKGLRKNFISPFIWKFIDEKDLGEINANK